jgi:hypothetical protein
MIGATPSPDGVHLRLLWYLAVALKSSTITKEHTMQQAITHKHPLWSIAIVLLLIVQGILGLFYSISQLTILLAPNQPIIVKGINIVTGPFAGISLAAAIGSFIIACGIWTWRPWAHQRTILLEMISLVLAAFDFIAPHVSKTVPLARVILVVLILLFLFAASRTHHGFTQNQEMNLSQ